MPAPTPLGPGLAEVEVPARPFDVFASLLGASAFAAFEGVANSARDLLAGRTVWCINSTATGGGVAEMLASLLALTRGAGVDTRWLVIEAQPEFFTLTKRLHHRLHDAPGDGGPLGVAEQSTYESALSRPAEAFARLVAPGDIVLLHDPQTAGMAAAATAAGAHVVWRSHIGTDSPGELAWHAVNFLLPYVRAADAYVFSRADYAWPQLDPERVFVIPPSIDPFAPKNQPFTTHVVEAVLRVSGLLAGHASPRRAVYFRTDATARRVLRRAELVQDAPLPAGAPLITQVSRWDPLKDPVGVLSAFAAHVDAPDSHLLLAGPQMAAVADDPEAPAVYAQVVEARRALPPATRRRVHLACLPMADIQENAAMVNAMQRYSSVVIQKSLAEGFGLTVAEAMWKGRPVVASAVGGIRDQIEDGRSGLLLGDPHDLEACGALVTRVLRDPALAARLGDNAQQRVRDHFLGPRHLTQWVELIEWLVTGAGEQPVRRLATAG